MGFFASFAVRTGAGFSGEENSQPVAPAGELLDGRLTAPMKATRVAAAVFSFCSGLVFLCGFGALSYFAGLPTLRELGAEQTSFILLHVGSLSLSGWKILAFDGLFLVVGVGLVALGIHLLRDGSQG